MKSANQLVVVAVDGLAVGGSAVGSVVDGETGLLGIRAFVRNAVPGDRVRARVVKEKKSFIEGELLEVIAPSAMRREPTCPVARDCGGCDLQFVKEVKHLHLKVQLLKGMMTAQGLDAGLVAREVRGPLKGCRRRVKLRFDGSGRLGFLQRASDNLVATTSCEQLEPALERLLLPLSQGLASLGYRGAVALESDGEQVLAVVAVGQRLSGALLRKTLAVLEPLVGGGRIECKGQVLRSFGSQELSLRLSGGHRLQLPAGSFSQVNQVMNQHLVDYVVALISQGAPRQCWDLYSGAGNFSIPLALSCPMRVVAVEGDQRLVRAGRELSGRAGAGVEFQRSSVEKFLKRGDLTPPDVILADPPRDGLKDLGQLLPKVPLLVLISCHLPSFVRDVKSLAQLGWKLDSVTPFDMFPLTNYLELVTVLSR